MNQDFKDRVVLVAGAGGGVGRVVSRTLLDRGAKVVLHYRTNAAALLELASAYPDRVLLHRGDLTNAGDVNGMVAACTARFGKLNAFLSTVGSALRIQPFLETSDETMEMTIDVELRSAIFCMRAVLPALITNGGGNVVLIGSDSGKVGTSGEAVSAACRGAIIAFAKSIAREYARQKVLVNVVCPGPIDTALWQDLVANDELGGKIGGGMIRATPLRRAAQPEEVAAAAVFLVSPAASFITGQALSVSGGLTMA
ncbi:SDR family NAD(P)-dependent oxidoreductase [Hydrogenophaga palleronii]|uniref:SDR family NAD(P)-dependent oxidoreductase n=1 Tax=Hydrogenophaga palleronii TaxID=65655 RepID=UPI000826473A|nr:SDR family oxidoreductase [Hydrogenophaga palleronii]